MAVTLAAEITGKDAHSSNVPYELVAVVGVSCLGCWLALAYVVYMAVRRRLGRFYGAVPNKEGDELPSSRRKQGAPARRVADPSRYPDHESMMHHPHHLHNMQQPAYGHDLPPPMAQRMQYGAPPPPPPEPSEPRIIEVDNNSDLRSIDVGSSHALTTDEIANRIFREQLAGAGAAMGMGGAGGLAGWERRRGQAQF